ncbi:putative sensor domain DACNV-containing protein [Adhaeribacter aquaticus]|uniref:putative sensor domain DACNV-containing protein n=1 Tax=Adhaeribacter aquaticus TaxID=299567 RepID=UPI0004114D39|nr:hypothetical protein [Adhaeribacter aquaticus]
MSHKITYQAARAVANTIEEHFAQHMAAASKHGKKNLAPIPHAPTIEAIIDATFWASLRREEGHFPKISLAFLPPEQASQPLIFEQRLSLTPTTLTKLAPAVERPGIHLGVWFEGENLHVWGATRTIPNLCFVLEVVEPGLLVIKHSHIDGFGKFTNVAVLKGDQVKIINEDTANLPDCPALVSSLLGFTTSNSWHDSVNVLVQLAVSMRAHSRGGTLLVVPANSTNWRNSIIHPIPYAIAPAFSTLKDIVEQMIKENNGGIWQRDLNRAVESIAGLTAVDGATIISDQYELLAFGAKIRRPTGGSPVEQIVVTEPIMGGGAVIVPPTQEGGTRHLSAAQFVHDQRDALALVASQDGKFTIFGWSPCEFMVHAHRVDALLL